MVTKAENELVRKFKDARRAYTPLVSIDTADQFRTVDMICGSVGNGNGVAPVPKITWDIAAGFQHRNEQGLRMLATRCGGKPQGFTDPIAAFQCMRAFDEDMILFVFNAQRFLENAMVMQCVANLRDQYKTNKRTLVLLGPNVSLPAELAQGDVVALDEPLPEIEELEGIVQRAYDGWEGMPWKLTKDHRARAAQMLRGCNAFAAEQYFTMAAADKPAGIDWKGLGDSVRKVVEETPGLSYESGTETFADVGGLTFAKTYGERLFKGPCRPACVVRVEEIEKAMAGSGGGDLSGTSSDALQVLLTAMEDFRWSGAIFYGPPGSGKSLFCKTLANTFDARGLTFDINACKGSLVGESERKIRQAVKVIKSIGGDRVFFVASCNDAEVINSALKRRFTSGTWFFDVPSEHDRAEIWRINRARFSIPDSDTTPDEPDLTGADIRNVCQQSWALASTLEEASQFVVPVKVQDPDSIERARSAAQGRYLDANRGGTYQRGSERKTGGRKIRQGGE